VRRTPKSARLRTVPVSAPIAVALITSLPVRSQPEPEEPKWITLQPNGGFVSVDVEAEQESSSSKTSPGTLTTRRLYVAPSIGVGALGSIYHPDLLSYSLNIAPGYVYQATGLPGAMTSSSEFLQSYSVTGTILQLKPYSTTLFANAGHDILEYDFFNSVIADQRTWGANSGFREGPVPFTFSFQDSHQTINGLWQDTTYDQTTFNVHAHNDREQNATSDLTFLYGQSRQETGGGSPFVDSNSYSQVYATDTEYFGKNSLYSTIIYNQYSTAGSASGDLTPSFELHLEHTERLHSNYGYSFTRYDDDYSEFNQHYLHAGVQHSLYDSLTSSIDIHGNQLDSSANGGAGFSSQRGGATGSISYTKALSDWGRFTLGIASGYDVTSQTSSGSAIPVPMESHSVTSATPWFRLAQPRAAFINTVTADASHGFQTLTEGVDYFVDRTVDPWQITLNFASLNVQHLESSGSVTVLVTYDIDPNPSGTYTTVSFTLNARLDLFSGLLGFYTRLQRIQNHADTPGFVLENLHEIEGGTDFNWKGVKLNAKYLDRRSSLYVYNAKILSEGYSFKLDDENRAGVTLRQQWSEFPLQNESARYYDFLAHYEWQEPAIRMTCSAEGGLQRQRGFGLNQDLLVARLRFEWLVGKLNISLRYDYQDQEFNSESRVRHFAYLKLKRTF
jgi:hypothetical protein